jgi:hypothetical protein
MAAPKNGFTARMIAAIGRSTRRDQWMLKPSGGLSRYWRRSYQPWPFSQARTSIIRILSSVSPSANQWTRPQYQEIRPMAKASQMMSVASRQRSSRRPGRTGSFVVIAHRLFARAPA